MKTSLMRSPAFASACVLGLAIVAGSAMRTGAAPTPRPTVAIQPNVAVVNLELINRLAELGDRNKAIAAHADQLKKVLEDTSDKIKAIDAELETGIPKSDVKRRAEKQAEKIELEGLRDARGRMYQRIINLEQGDVIRELYLKLVAKAQDVAVKGGYDLVLLDDSSLKIPERATAEEFGLLLRERSVLYRNPAMDISDRILTIMNNEYASSGGKQ